MRFLHEISSCISCRKGKECWRKVAKEILRNKKIETSKELLHELTKESKTRKNYKNPSRINAMNKCQFELPNKDAIRNLFKNFNRGKKMGLVQAKTP